MQWRANCIPWGRYHLHPHQQWIKTTIFFMASQILALLYVLVRVPEKKQIVPWRGDNEQTTSERVGRDKWRKGGREAPGDWQSRKLVPPLEMKGQGMARAQQPESRRKASYRSCGCGEGQLRQGGVRESPCALSPTSQPGQIKASHDGAHRGPSERHRVGQEDSRSIMLLYLYLSVGGDMASNFDFNLFPRLLIRVGTFS